LNENFGKSLIYHNEKASFQFVPLTSVIRNIRNRNYAKKHDDYNVSRTMTLERIQNKEKL